MNESVTRRNTGQLTKSRIMQNNTNTHNITIRKAILKDSEFIAQSNIAMASETENTILDPDTVLNGVSNLINQPQYGFYMVAESGDQAIACLLITFEWSDWRNGLLWWIQSVYVLPEWRRLGVYKKMYSTLQSMSQNDPGVAGLRLYVHTHNDRAITTYQSLGMSKTPYLLYEWIP